MYAASIGLCSNGNGSRTPMMITIQMSVKRKQEDEGPTDPEAIEEPRKETKVDEEVKVATNDAPADEKKEKDLSDPANNHLIRKYLVAIEKEDKLFLQETINKMTAERLREELEKGATSLQVNIKAGRKDIGTVKVTPPQRLIIQVITPKQVWHPFDAIHGYGVCLADESDDSGLKPTPGFEDVPSKPPKGKDGPETIRNFEKWLAKVDEHQKLSTESATFKFDQIPIAKFHKIPDLLRGLYKYMDKHPSLLV